MPIYIGEPFADPKKNFGGYGSAQEWFDATITRSDGAAGEAVDDELPPPPPPQLAEDDDKKSERSDGAAKITDVFSAEQLALLENAADFLLGMYRDDRDAFLAFEWVDKVALGNVGSLQIYGWGSVLIGEDGTTVPWPIVCALFVESVSANEKVGLGVLNDKIAEPKDQNWQNLMDFSPFNFQLFPPQILQTGKRGVQIWSDGSVRTSTGAPLGTVNNYGYAKLGSSPVDDIAAKTPSVHNVIVYAATNRVYPAENGDTIDHLGSSLNNRIDCLRPATKSMQMINRMLPGTQSYFGGVMTVEEDETKHLLKAIDIIDVKTRKILKTIDTWGPHKQPLRIHQKTGRIFVQRSDGWRVLKGCKNPSGYVALTLQGEPYKLHRLVAMNVPRLVKQLENLPIGEELEVNHLGDEKDDNRPEMLQWTTKTENLQHAHGKPTIVEYRGERFAGPSVVDVCRKIESKYGKKSETVRNWITGRRKPDEGFIVKHCDDSNRPATKERKKKGGVSRQKRYEIEFMVEKKRRKAEVIGYDGIVSFLKNELKIEATNSAVYHWIRKIKIPQRHSDVLLSISAVDA